LSPAVTIGGALALLAGGVLLSTVARAGPGKARLGRARRGPSAGDAGDNVVGAVGATADLVGRLVAAAGALALLRLVLPEAVVGTVPFLAAAVAFAVGWSARDLLRDLLAAVVLGASDEGLDPGASVSGPGWEGTLRRRTLRGVELTGVDGERLVVPWRRLLAEPFRVEAAQQRPVHTFEVTLEDRKGNGAAGADGLRRRVREAIAASPAVPAGAIPQMLRDPHAPDRFELRGPVVSRRFARRGGAEVRDRLADAVRGNGDP